MWKFSDFVFLHWDINSHSTHSSGIVVTLQWNSVAYFSYETCLPHGEMSSQLVPILSTLKIWRTEFTLGPINKYELRTPELIIQYPIYLKATATTTIYLHLRVSVFIFSCICTTSTLTKQTFLELKIDMKRNF